MTHIDDSPVQSTSAESQAGPGNAVAMVGLVLTMAAMLCCGLLFGAAGQLAEHERERLDLAATRAAATDSEDTDAVEDTAAQSARSAEQLRLLLLASVAIVLNLVGLVLCVAGLLIPNRPRAVAIGGTFLSALLLMGVFGVVAVGTLFRA